MELNNKFGICCACPGNLSDGRLFTSYMPRKDLNNNMMRDLNAKNSNQYREILQTHGISISETLQTQLEKDYKCHNNGNNKFYQVDDINDHFDKLFKNTLLEKTDINTN